MDFSFYRWKDKRRYKKGLAWNVEIPWIMSFAIHVLVTIKNLFTKKETNYESLLVKY